MTKREQLTWGGIVLFALFLTGITLFIVEGAQYEHEFRVTNSRVSE